MLAAAAEQTSSTPTFTRATRGGVGVPSPTPYPTTTTVATTPPPLAPFDCDLSPRPIPSHPLTHDDCESERVEPPIR